MIMNREKEKKIWQIVVCGAINTFQLNLDTSVNIATCTNICMYMYIVHAFVIAFYCLLELNVSLCLCVCCLCVLVCVCVCVCLCMCGLSVYLFSFLFYKLCE